MGRLSGFSYREVTKRLKKFGVVWQRQARGSHEVWGNKSKGKKALIPRHAGDIPEGTLRSILKDLDISPNEFLGK